MILVFPDADTFRLALTGGFVPADVTLAPAAVSFDPAGRIFLETDAKLSKKAAGELARLGVVGSKRHPADPQPVTCWPQVVPAEKDAAPPQLASAAPVLFELPSAAELAAVVSEMLRLGNDRQSFRWVAGEDESHPRVLLRVIGPPYYTLLRALDHPGAAGVRAYFEQAPRVWVEVGYSHPLAAQVRVADGQIVLVRPPRDWSFVADAPFRDVYEALRFTLPAAPSAWEEAPVESKLTVPLKLVPGNAADVPELWVLRGDAADRLDAFVRDADDRTVQRLKFAVGTDAAGRQVIVLRTTPSKLAPPALELEGAVGFKPFWKIPNLYVPAGTRLHPQLRRDVVRKLLADDTDQLVWLFPGAGGAFTPETLPEDSFRPLEDWVDYVIEANHAPLAAWVEATRFGFEGFICSENQPPKKDDKGPSKGKKGGKDDDGLFAPTTEKPVAKPKEAKGPAAPAFVPEAVEAKPPSEWERVRKDLEEQFLAVDGPLDAPERQALWPELAAANAGYGDRDEAGVCWVNALWGPADPPAGWLDGWLRSEFPEVQRPVPAAMFDQRMKPAEPTPGEMRQFAAVLLHAAYQSPPPAWLPAKLPAVQHYLEAHEAKLPVRTAWLAASRLAQLTGADVLGLARVRDRLLQRLLEEGLNPERNLPHFLRYAGHKDSARVRLVREKALELHRSIRAWTEKGLKAPAALSQSDGGGTGGFIDLLFAFAMARLGESTAAKGLVDSAKRVLVTSERPESAAKEGAGIVPETRRISWGWLFEAYQYRYEQAVGGKPSTGRLAPTLYDEVDEIDRRGNGSTNSPAGMAHYIISRLRQQSRVLEPQEVLEPYGKYMKHGDMFRAALADLPLIREPQLLARTIRELYRTGGGTATPDTRFGTLLEGLPLAGRVGEAFTVELLGLVPETMKALGSAPTGAGGAPADLPRKQGQLLERALLLAAHFDRRDVVQQLVDQFVQLVHGRPDDQRYEVINVVAGQCLRSLRKLGLRDEIDRLLRRLQDEVLKGQTPAQLRAKLKPELWGKALQTLLYLAGGWLTYGLGSQATPIFDEARTELLGPGAAKYQPKDYTPLAQAYVAALGHGPADTGLPRIIELFHKADPERVKNGFTTAAYFSRFHLNLAEEVVLALVSDDFALGAAGRRWLEEDEYLIRRRIHADMKRHLDRSGL